jgi:hypothetical protein
MMLGGVRRMAVPLGPGAAMPGPRPMPLPTADIGRSAMPAMRVGTPAIPGMRLPGRRGLPGLGAGLARRALLGGMKGP